ncbi:MAG: PilN domain-containing protein [Deltaproteobacteria bacterium]|nr:PilN domain-containing protein [Deltaproteobacteria bacterium]
MIAAEAMGRTKFFLSKTAGQASGWWEQLWRLLSFSLADDRIAPVRRLSVVLESGGVSVVYFSRFLMSRMKNRGSRRYPFEEGRYPTPENVASAAALAVSDLGAAGAPATLVVPRAWTIVKTAEFPSTVRENLSDVVSYELDRITPLLPEKAFYDYRILSEEENRIRIVLAAMKAETLQPYMDALEGKGIALRQVLPAPDPGSDGSPVSQAARDTAAGEMNLLCKGVHKAPGTPMALTIVLASLLAALGLCWLMSPLWIAEQRIEIIDREIAARKDEVKKVEASRKELGGLETEIAAIAAFKTSRPVMLDLLKEMTRVLPTNTWLSRIRFTESTVEIEGYAASATEILPKLEASAYFKKVEFASPTARDIRLNADRFSIKMEIEGLPEGKAKK